MALTREHIKLVTEVKEELMAKRGKLLDILDGNEVPKIQVEIESQELKSKINALDSLLESADALLNVGEVLPPLKVVDEIALFVDEPQAYQSVASYNEARSEDTAILAKKINIIKNLARLLEICKGAISDAIYCEDGLDGSVGEDLIKEIDGIKDLEKLTTCQECDYLVQENLKLGEGLGKKLVGLKEVIFLKLPQQIQGMGIPESVAREIAKVIAQAITQRLKGGQMKHIEFVRGFACAIADLIRDHNQPTIALDILSRNGITLEEMKKSKVDKYDLEVIELELKGEGK